ncbi:hypothetical protein A2U01_0086007, partial [Trifolium medium]|nr:hypothetical protein [Trifolium medium]
EEVQLREEWKKQQKAAKFCLPGAQGANLWAQGAGGSTRFSVSLPSNKVISKSSPQGLCQRD